MTQLQSAKAGKATPEMKRVAAEEKISPRKLLKLVESGRAVIPANPRHKKLRAIGIGSLLRTKVNANIGTSPGHSSLKQELAKLRACEKFKADTVMDLSTGGNINLVRRKVIAKTSLPVGTVPIYGAAVEKGLVNLTEDDFLNQVEKQARQGIDFATLHCGITRGSMKLVKKRRHGIVSRGGSMTFCWMKLTGKENPLFKHYDALLDILQEHDVTASLGDALRPGCIADATDRAQLSELKALGKLATRAKKAGVQSIIEGPGHVPLNEIEKNMRLEQKYCHGAPFYVLGPLPTDIGFGYDHITCAIGGALAGYYGASFLCYVTPSEHLSLPRIDDVKEGIVATRIAAHAADIAKGLPHAMDWDNAVSDARKSLDWKTLFRLSLDPEKARAYRKKSGAKGKECTMCGEYCALKVL